jgi:hypothetical protein
VHTIPSTHHLHNARTLTLTPNAATCLKLLTLQVSAYHPDIDASYDAGIAIDLASHPDLQETFAAALPPTHPPVGTLLARCS